MVTPASGVSPPSTKAARPDPAQTQPPIETRSQSTENTQDVGDVGNVKGDVKDNGEDKVGCFSRWRKVFKPSQWNGKHAEAADQWLRFMGESKTQKESTSETRRLIMPNLKEIRAPKKPNDGLATDSSTISATSPQTAKKQRPKLTAEELDHARTRAVDYASSTTSSPTANEAWQVFVGRRLKMLATEWPEGRSSHMQVCSIEYKRKAK